MLAPGERILVPTRIAFTPSEGSVDQFSYPQTAAQLFASRGSQGFTGNTAAHKAPDLKEFVYGPEISISGIISTANTTINFKETTKTALNITISADSGSCPILLFRVERSMDQLWKNTPDGKGSCRRDLGNHCLSRTGKPVQARRERAGGCAASPSHTNASAKEWGSIDANEALTLTPNQPFDRDGLELLWGDAFEFSIDVPESVSGDAVVE